MSKTAGLVTAAGASRRMGSPKALLRDAHGQTLAERQTSLLEAGGCDPVAVVIGAAADHLRSSLPNTLRLVENPQWAAGRLTSVQAGLQELLAKNQLDGIVILPIDSVGIQRQTITKLLEFAQTNTHPVIRPVHEDQRGHLVWISAKIAQDVISFSGDPDTPLHRILEPFTTAWPVADAAILTNFNTPEDWAQHPDAASGTDFAHPEDL